MKPDTEIRRLAEILTEDLSRQYDKWTPDNQLNQRIKSAMADAMEYAIAVRGLYHTTPPQPALDREELGKRLYELERDKNPDVMTAWEGVSECLREDYRQVATQFARSVSRQEGGTCKWKKSDSKGSFDYSRFETGCNNFYYEPKPHMVFRFCPFCSKEIQQGGTTTP